MGILKSEMYQLYDIYDEKPSRYEINDYMRFYTEERQQEQSLWQTPSEVRQAALEAETLLHILSQKTNE